MADLARGDSSESVIVRDLGAKATELAKTKKLQLIGSFQHINLTVTLGVMIPTAFHFCFT